MNRISQKDMQKLADQSAEIVAIYDEIDAVLAEAREKVDKLIADANDIRELAAGDLADLRDAVDSYYDERSERWQEGEKGQAYSTWKDALGSLVDDLETELEAVEIADPDRPDWLSQLEEGAFQEPDE